MVSLAHGDSASLGEIYDRYEAVVRKAVYRFAPEMSAADVEDCTHDVFLVLHNTASRYEERTRLKAWLCGIAVRKARSWRRRTWLRRRLIKEHGREGLAMAKRAEMGPERLASLREDVRTSLGLLTRAQREILELRLVDGFSSEEIGEILGLKSQAVRGRLHRARRSILESLEAVLPPIGVDVPEKVKT